MIGMIGTLIDNGSAYEAEGHVLFDVSSYADYGALSRRDLREMMAGARVEVAPYKKAPHDFVLWKPSTPELPGWESPWGRGRPGWHIECSAMAEKHLGRTIDIHAGGQDLVFPHHENELAQSTCAHQGQQFVRYWVHNGFLSIDSTKMSKSLGNVLLVRDLIKSIPGEVVRLALIAAHYRQPLDWSDESLQSARKVLDRFYSAVRGIDVDADLRSRTSPPRAVIAALEDDLNTPQAIAEMFSVARQLNKTEDQGARRSLAAALLAGGDLLGLLQNDVEEWFEGSDAGAISAPEIEALIEQRNAARAAKDFETADAMRAQLSAAGVAIEDGPDGTRWRRT
jgi:cysteinyl-tRNA synthetase